MQCSLYDRYIDGYSYLINIPISSTSLPSLDTLLLASPHPSTLDVFSSRLIKHRFAGSGSRSRPVRIEVNARKGRRAMCVLYGDGLKYEVFDLDAEVGEE